MDRDEIGAQPHRLAVLADQLEGTVTGIAPRQRRPEFAMIADRAGVGIVKDAMMLAHDLIEGVARGFQKGLIGGENDAIGRQFDQRVIAPRVMVFSGRRIRRKLSHEVPLGVHLSGHYD